jgi:acetate---CoA ligase (ADP-forming)
MRSIARAATERPVSAASLDPLLRPSSVAIAGLSADVTKHGGQALNQLRRFGFKGSIWGVNPRRPRIPGVPVFASIQELPEPPDALVIAVPGSAVTEVVREAAEAGVKGALIFASGFAESGTVGKALQAELLSARSGTDLRLLGPNSAGVIHPAAGTVLSFLTCLHRPPEELRSGPVGLITQSGGIASYIHNLAASQGTGLAITVSTGNEVDVTAGEMLAYLVEHPEVRTIALVLETVRDGDPFVAAARAAQEAGKPVIAFKLGKSPAGQKLATTHTGALASPQRIYEAAFESLSITEVGSSRDLFEVAHLLATVPPPTRNSVGVVTHSGGHAIAVADLADEVGVSLPEPTPALTRIMQERVPLNNPTNPLDIGGIITDPERYTRAVDCFLDESEFAAVIAVSSPHSPADSLARARELAELADRTRKPLINVWSAGDVNCAGLEFLRNAGKAVTESPHIALTALRALLKQQATAKRVDSDSSEIDAIESALARVKGSHSTGGPLPEVESKALLEEFGLPMLTERLVHTSDEALAAANEIGYPVVLKAIADGLFHKTDAGAVHVDIRGDDELSAAYERSRRSLGSLSPPLDMTGALISEFAPGPEALLGGTVDAAFGPMVMTGVGGVQAELLEDVSLRLAPISEAQAGEMLASLRGVGALSGHRGGREGDLHELAALAAKVSEILARSGGWIAEIDVNPLIYTDRGWRVADALVVLADLQGAPARARDRHD